MKVTICCLVSGRFGQDPRSETHDCAVYVGLAKQVLPCAVTLCLALFDCLLPSLCFHDCIAVVLFPLCPDSVETLDSIILKDPTCQTSSES